MSRVWLSPTTSTVRVGDGPGPEYRASGEVVRVESLAFLVGFSGRLTGDDVESVYLELHRSGARYALARRLHPHRLPHARLVTFPFLGDWFLVDLEEFSKRHQSKP